MDNLSKALIRYSIIVRVLFSLILGLVIYLITNSIKYSIILVSVLLIISVIGTINEYKNNKKKE